MIYEQNGNDTVIFLDMAAAAENKTGPRFVDNLPGLLMVFRRKSSKFQLDTFPELFPQRKLFVLLKREIFEEIS
jgi:hypothetical protein